MHERRLAMAAFMGLTLAGLFLLAACGSPEPTATPTPTPEPTATPTPTATPLPPRLEGGSLAGGLDARLDAIRETMETVEPVWTVYVHGEDWETPGGNTLMNDIFELLKLDNIATHDGYQVLQPGGSGRARTRHHHHGLAIERDRRP